MKWFSPHQETQKIASGFAPDCICQGNMISCVIISKILSVLLSIHFNDLSEFLAMHSTFYFKTLEHKKDLRKGLKYLAFYRALKVIYHLNSCETQASINLSINSQVLRMAARKVKPPDAQTSWCAVLHNQSAPLISFSLLGHRILKHCHCSELTNLYTTCKIL